MPLLRATPPLFAAALLTLAAPTLLAATVLTLAASPQASAEDQAAQVPSEPVSTTATYGDWVVHCVLLPGAQTDSPATRSCEAVQTVQAEGQAQPIAQVAIGRLPDAPTRMLTALVPVNITFAAPAHISGNGKSGADEIGGLDLGWQRCFAGSCAANGDLSEDALAPLRSGTSGSLTFTDATGAPVTIPLSWKGLDQALAAIDKAGN